MCNVVRDKAMHHVKEQVIVTVSTLGIPMVSHDAKERILFTVLCTDLQQLGENVAQPDSPEKP